jgi:hypothetical protein
MPRLLAAGLRHGYVRPSRRGMIARAGDDRPGPPTMEARLPPCTEARLLADVQAEVKKAIASGLTKEQLVKQL